jgi:hypothetical protein
VQKGKKVNDLRKFLGKKNRKNKYWKFDSILFLW